MELEALATAGAFSFSIIYIIMLKNKKYAL